MSQNNEYVGLDVSLKETSICVIDDADKIVWRGQVDSTPEAIGSSVKQRAPHAVRIRLQSGQLSSWLFHELKKAEPPRDLCRCAPRQGSAVAKGQQDRRERRPRSGRRSCASAGTAQ